MQLERLHSELNTAVSPMNKFQDIIHVTPLHILETTTEHLDMWIWENVFPIGELMGYIGQNHWLTYQVPFTEVLIPWTKSVKIMCQVWLHHMNSWDKNEGYPQITL